MIPHKDNCPQSTLSVNPAEKPAGFAFYLYFISIVKYNVPIEFLLERLGIGYEKGIGTDSLSDYGADHLRQLRGREKV